jgi:two-component system phosphate regulon sensor histidine kinase PhoR
LIFAVLAAAAALAYYGYSATSEQTSRDRERTLMQDLAEEKVANLEFLLTTADESLMKRVELDKLTDEQFINGLRDASGSAIASVYVLDDKLQLVPGGHIGRKGAAGTAYLEWFMSRVLPPQPEGQDLAGKLARVEPNVRKHLYLNVGFGSGNTTPKPYLLSYMKRSSAGRTYYVIVEDDTNYVTQVLFPQFFVQSSKRLYQVVDETGLVRSGDPFVYQADDTLVERKFVDTFDGWALRVAQRDTPDVAAEQRKRFINSVVIGGAVGIIVIGLIALVFAIRRERRLNDLKSEFISNVSHELKTPLSIISMFGEMLANGRTKSPEQAHEYAEIIWRESVRLGRLIDNVLDFAKMERGMDVYEFGEDVDVIETVARAVELSGRRVAAAEMTMTSVLPEELPLARLDANAFTLAVMNLIDNAVKYAADGKKIEVSLRQEDDKTIVLAVRDWGPGIDPEEQHRIFERFYRAKSIRLKPIRGSGIGLALVQHIARAHGGEVTVTSKPNEGSTFSILLPIDGKK